MEAYAIPSVMGSPYGVITTLISQNGRKATRPAPKTNGTLISEPGPVLQRLDACASGPRNAARGCCVLPLLAHTHTRNERKGRRKKGRKTTTTTTTTNQTLRLSVACHSEIKTVGCFVYLRVSLSGLGAFWASAHRRKNVASRLWGRVLYGHVRSIIFVCNSSTTANTGSLFWASTPFCITAEDHRQHPISSAYRYTSASSLNSISAPHQVPRPAL